MGRGVAHHGDEDEVLGARLVKTIVRYSKAQSLCGRRPLLTVRSTPIPDLLLQLTADNILTSELFREG